MFAEAGKATTARKSKGKGRKRVRRQEGRQEGGKEGESIATL